MDYKELLEHSYKVETEDAECPPESRLEYLGDHIFDFTTYDGDMSALFASKAVEVCAAINNRSTFDYIHQSQEDYKWFLIMCNMPFFADRLSWGTSIRGAWWDAKPGEQIEFQSCGLWIGNEQCSDMIKFSCEEWSLFISAIIDFAMPDLSKSGQIDVSETRA